MVVFHYHPDTGIYVGSSEPEESPLDAGNFLIPAFTTPLAPPQLIEGFEVKFDGVAWGYVPVEDPDAPPTEKPPLSSAQVDTERDRRINLGFIFAEVLYQSDTEARENISGAATAALAALMRGATEGDFRWHGGAEDFEWIDMENERHPMDAQTMFALGEAALAHKRRLIFAGNDLKKMDPIPDDFATNDDYWS